MKLSKLISAAAVFAGLFAVQNAGAWGAIVSNDTGGGVPVGGNLGVGVSHSKDSVAEAITAAQEACVDIDDNSVSNCTGEVAVFADVRAAAGIVNGGPSGSEKHLIAYTVLPSTIMDEDQGAAIYRSGDTNSCENVIRAAFPAFSFSDITPQCRDLTPLFNVLDETNCPGGKVPSGRECACPDDTTEVEGECTCTGNGVILNDDGMCVAPTNDAECQQIDADQIYDSTEGACIYPDDNAECQQLKGAGYVYDADPDIEGCVMPGNDSQCQELNAEHIYDGDAEMCRFATETAECVRLHGGAATDFVYDTADESCGCPANHTETPPNSGACVQDELPPPPDCEGDGISGTIPNADGDACVCPDDAAIINAQGNACVSDCAGVSGSVLDRDINQCICRANEEVNTQGTACVCGDGFEFYDTGDGVGRCAAALDDTTGGEYTTSQCEEAGWASESEVDDAGLIRETCQIPVRVQTDFDAGQAPAAASSSGIRALVAADVRNGGDFRSCIIREHAAFNDGTSLPRCEDPMLFGDAGLPEKPAAINKDETDTTNYRIVVAADNVLVLATVADENAPVVRENVVQEPVVRFTPAPAVVGGGGGGSNYDTARAYIGAIGLMTFVAAFYKTGGDLAAFSFTPDYSFSAKDGGAAYSYGTRLDYESGNFSAFWAAGREHYGGADGWNYSNGIEYGGDSWTLGYAGEIFGDKTGAELSAAVSDGAGIFHWRSGIVADYRGRRGKDGDLSAFWRNSLTADYRHWIIEPSANVYFREGGGLADDVRLRLNLRREL